MDRHGKGEQAQSATQAPNNDGNDGRVLFAAEGGQGRKAPRAKWRGRQLARQ